MLLEEVSLKSRAKDLCLTVRIVNKVHSICFFEKETVFSVFL